MMEPLSAMISYQWTDGAAAELLHEELALRGLVVHHDRCTFPTGSRIGTNMDEAVANCDGFVAYLTPNSLYEGAPSGAPRPAIDAEFKPAMDRLARSHAPAGRRRPVIIPLTHGLGDPRSEAPERVRKATGKDISTLWTPVTLDQASTSISESEAAAVGRCLLSALLTPEDTQTRTTDPIQMSITTRGEGQPPAFLSIDATNLVGGQDHRPGESRAWARYLVGLRDLQSVLARGTDRRQLNIRIRAHLSAAIGFGRVFNQAAGWRPAIAGRHGTTRASDEVGHDELKISLEKGERSANLSVEIDLLDVGVSDLSAAVLMNLADPVTNRLCVWRQGQRSDLEPSDISAMASSAALAIRDAVFEIRPARVHIFCAAPVEFALLLGHRLTSLHTEIHLYERDGDSYLPSLVIPGNT